MILENKIQDEQRSLLNAAVAFLTKYNIYDVEMRLDNCEKEILCYGQGSLSCDNLSIRRDYFDTINNLSLDNNHQLNLIGVEFPQQDVIRLIKTNGNIFVKGIYEQERESSKHSLDIRKKLKRIPDIARKDLIDWTLSRRIDGIPYYVLDLFRIKGFDFEYMNFLADVRYFLHISDYRDITKTIYFTPYKQGNSEYIIIGVWDIVNSNPVNGKKCYKIKKKL